MKSIPPSPKDKKKKAMAGYIDPYLERVKSGKEVTSATLKMPVVKKKSGVKIGYGKSSETSVRRGYE